MFKDKYEDLRERTEKHLQSICASWADLPQALSASMEYSLMARGKRLRPVLLLAANDLFHGDLDKALPFACSLEMIHTYSLIHDDLPGMDDDDMRRGRPSNHIVHGVGMAILAGDGLLNGAFELMTHAVIQQDCRKESVMALDTISHASGIRGMIAGQCIDLKSEDQPIDEQTLEYIHTHKTGDMITGALVAGAYLAGAGEDDVSRIRRYGQCLGLAFQITDDILDIIGDADALGKPVGSDERNIKATYPRLYGLEKAKAYAAELVAEAKDSLLGYAEGEFLSALADSVLHRKN